MLPSVREIASGKWHGILVALGFREEMLNGKHQPCPTCGGVDRFRFDDKAGNGTSYCSHCGPTDGVGLVMRVKGLAFRDAAAEIERVAGFVKPSEYRPAVSDDEKIRALRKAWQQSRPVMEGDEVSRYLTGRGLMVPRSKVLRCHPGMQYREDNRVTGTYPAMLALVTAPDGSGVSIHRTYLEAGGKAPVGMPKKMMPGLPISGASICLYPAGPTLGIAEGIESAIGASMRFQLPVHAAINASIMESWVPPDGVRDVVIFGDNDETFTGHKSAYALAYKLHAKGLSVRVEIPQRIGSDWADANP